jgi:hypothetical protein
MFAFLTHLLILTYKRAGKKKIAVNFYPLGKENGSFFSYLNVTL